MTDPALDPLCSSWTFNADGTLTVRAPAGQERPIRALMAAMGYVCPIIEDMPDGSVLMHDSLAIVEIFNDRPVSDRRGTDPEAPGGPWYDGPDRDAVDCLGRY